MSSKILAAGFLAAFAVACSGTGETEGTADPAITSAPRHSKLARRGSKPQDNKTPWCALDPKTKNPEGVIACGPGFTCTTARVPTRILGSADDSAPNDPKKIGWNGPACGQGNEDDATCPRYCIATAEYKPWWWPAAGGEKGLDCPKGFRKTNVHVPTAILGNESAPNDFDELGWDGSACGKGQEDFESCPRYCEISRH